MIPADAVRREVEEALGAIHDRTIKRSRVWAALRDGTLREEHYAGLLREWYHYTQHSGGVLEGALLPHLVGRHRELVRGLLKHAIEEEPHYRLCEHDLSAMGRDVEMLRRSRPLPFTEALSAFVYARMQLGDAVVAYLGHRLSLEQLGATYGAPAMQMLTTCLPNAAPAWFTFLRAHAEDDGAHVEEIIELLGRCMAGRSLVDVLEVAETSATLYAAMLDGAFAEPWAEITSRC
jgi:pyrroloquinoline quinone (PQQ) biosynthesis protein C